MGAMADDGLEALFRRTLPALDVAPGEALVTTLARFVRLLYKWNRACNLTAIREPEAMAVRHVLDALSARPFLAGQAVLDVGCGAGLPGIPLALAEPQRQFCLVDSGNKKVRFVRQAIAELHIPNISVRHARVEALADGPFDSIICRAWTALADFADRTAPLLAPGGRLVAMKGCDPLAEREALGADWAVQVTRVTVPDLDAERHIVVLERAAGAGA